ncbi:hypothetical protein EN904_08420 [Mesorhizobium sp. M7A.F.Ca.CA.001.07.2.1]|jgi:hypothetical protein|uniref:hypothetical protein n=1 Tax=Mesorhizobium TaxID=68287 RepID=UPI000FCB48BE|nr:MULTISPECIES: hypothetical protein [Mesorhizobium]RVB07526.1 hypothetical protein EN918_37385 [Mesorhizobium sp. M7A.F.Ca.CA.004.05.1.1]MCF6126280.1 hypothetical protein [Mesorhizobium ciceri]MCQ8816292.1 hypothetical protein [Mesorhizobium sp. SEMIA396]RUX82372.1 hypothetical protein EN983_01420 [Mesorhizobium sp. M7A.F.Ca.CA.004.08.2.1]RUX87887.1 hypothetical protein EN982_09030 [Mesorhizobium sp. M7A.F.Ca.CA.004.08.1.1]
MSSVHPVRALSAALEAARTNAVETIAADGGPLSSAVLAELAMLQTALTATRQTLDEHGTRLGWGGDEGAVDQAVLELHSIK